MPKQQNTVAKPKRVADKKRKVTSTKKTATRTKKQPVSENVSESSSSLSPEEDSVLGVFRKYLMTPRKMLCFSKADIEVYKKPLAKLTTKGLLIAEKYQGGYSLTEDGFAAMRHAEARA